MLCGYNCIVFINLKTQKIVYLQLDLCFLLDKIFELLLFAGGGQISLRRLYLSVYKGITFRMR